MILPEMKAWSEGLAVRHCKSEARSGRVRGDEDELSTMRLNELTRDCETKAGAAAACASCERQEQALAHIGGDAGTVVRDFDDDHVPLAPSFDENALAALGLRRHCFERLTRIAEQIQQHPKQLF